MHQSQRSPTDKSFCRLRVSSSPRRLHRLYNEILGHNGAANVAPPPRSPRLFFPILPSFQDEEWNAPQWIAFFSSRGNWGSRRGALWCYFPFRVGWRCLVAQLKMIIWEWNKVPPSGSHSDMQAAKVPTNESGCADENELQLQCWWRSFICSASLSQRSDLKLRGQWAFIVVSSQKGWEGYRQATLSHFYSIHCIIREWGTAWCRWRQAQHRPPIVQKPRLCATRR